MIVREVGSGVGVNVDVGGEFVAAVMGVRARARVWVGVVDFAGGDGGGGG